MADPKKVVFINPCEYPCSDVVETWVQFGFGFYKLTLLANSVDVLFPTKCEVYTIIMQIQGVFNIQNAPIFL